MTEHLSIYSRCLSEKIRYLLPKERKSCLEAAFLCCKVAHTGSEMREIFRGIFNNPADSLMIPPFTQKEQGKEKLICSLPHS